MFSPSGIWWILISTTKKSMLIIISHCNSFISPPLIFLSLQLLQTRSVYLDSVMDLKLQGRIDYREHCLMNRQMFESSNNHNLNLFDKVFFEPGKANWFDSNRSILFLFNSYLIVYIMIINNSSIINWDKQPTSDQDSAACFIIIIIIIIIVIYLFKVDDIAKILHAQKIYIKLSNTRIWYAN